MALTKFGRETHKTTTPNRQVPSTVPSAVGALSALISRRFTTKQYTWDEDGGEEDAFSGCIWRGMTTSSRTQTSMTVGRRTTLERCIVILCACANLPWHLFEGGVYFTSNCAAFIQGRCLFAEIR